ncbi:HPF/RaiA family ribosome-associated protein [Spartinivicinus poritis]|uniref:HPF/RaiA family ribosome-associated protein n=1 Tax=Spartinivicinus poritis TaxID=2994640 RepID=A0ABT5U5G2_9GAMM|nr:HPF/RaiA family ribosome-associated protein [Spartinivicinus sp. A2-2]MDE1460797.1 HPF/RaiA family ribosome-associated protein [Spartinivicinus sp. A2-2]
MNINISLRNLSDNGEIINYIDHRLSFAFARTFDKIAHASITLSNINGPKGGIDKQCQIILKPIGMRKIVVSEKQESLRQAIDQCLHRASQCLNRKVKRKQVLFRKQQQKATLHSVSLVS